jgi:hypothetical protein
MIAGLPKNLKELPKFYFNQLSKADLSLEQHPNVVIDYFNGERNYFFLDAHRMTWFSDSEFNRHHPSPIFDDQLVAELDNLRASKTQNINPNQVKWAKYGAIKDTFNYRQTFQDWTQGGDDFLDTRPAVKVNDFNTIYALNSIRNARLDIITLGQLNAKPRYEEAQMSPSYTAQPTNMTPTFAQHTTQHNDNNLPHQALQNSPHKILEDIVSGKTDNNAQQGQAATREQHLTRSSNNVQHDDNT